MFGPFTVDDASELIRGLFQRAAEVETKSVFWFKDGSVKWANEGFIYAAQLRQDAFKLIEVSKVFQSRTRYDHLREDE